MDESRASRAWNDFGLILISSPLVDNRGVIDVPLPLENGGSMSPAASPSSMTRQ
jgi:hypothetical protein